MVSRCRTLCFCLLAGTIACGCWLGPPRQLETGTTITVSLSPTSIPADGTTTSTATATVDDSAMAGVAGDAVTFKSSDTGEKISTTTDNNNGTYTATITSSTTVGTDQRSLRPIPLRL